LTIRPLLYLLLIDIETIVITPLDCPNLAATSIACPRHGLRSRSEFNRRFSQHTLYKYVFISIHYTRRIFYYLTYQHQ
jgi:hypothetical protein